MSRKRAPHGAAYEICIEGRLGDEWAGWFDGWTVRGQGDGGLPPVTTLTGRVVDQAGLRGILNKLWDLNLTLVSVRRLEKPAQLDPATQGAAQIGPVLETGPISKAQGD